MPKSRASRLRLGGTHLNGNHWVQEWRDNDNLGFRALTTVDKETERLPSMSATAAVERADTVQVISNRGSKAMDSHKQVKSGQYQKSIKENSQRQTTGAGVTPDHREKGKHQEIRDQQKKNK